MMKFVKMYEVRVLFSHFVLVFGCIYWIRFCKPYGSDTVIKLEFRELDHMAMSRSQASSSRKKRQLNSQFTVVGVSLSQSQRFSKQMEHHMCVSSRTHIETLTGVV